MAMRSGAAAAAAAAATGNATTRRGAREGGAPTGTLPSSRVIPQSLLLFSFFVLTGNIASHEAAAAASGSSGRRVDPWRTARVLAERWGDDKGTVQVFRDFRTVLALHSIDDYMTNTVHSDPFYEPVRDSCYLEFKWCAEMASNGLCPDQGIEELNSEGQCPDGPSGFMEKSCAPACRMCHLKSYETRCPFDGEALSKSSDALKGSGELNMMFERMITEESHQRYGPIQVHSMPGGGADPSTIDGPWVVSFENFLTEDECIKLRNLGSTTGEGFQRSHIGVDPTNSTDFRTSSTNWCLDQCHLDPDVQRIHRRIESIVGVIPQTNYEYLQILRYEEGQFYGNHHDYNAVEVDRPQGVRLLTVFLYLNDVEEGGGTNFPDLGEDEGLTVMPKMGKALVWPSVYDSDPNKMDPRTQHGALTVIKGTKFGANAWIHMRDHKTPFAKNCQ